MHYLTLSELLSLYMQVMAQSGGSIGIRDWGLLNSALAQPRMRVGGKHLYPSVVEKAAALGFSLIMNHPMVDGNKRLGHAAMELFLMLNGHEIRASANEQERIILALAAGELGREAASKDEPEPVVDETITC
ncbi:MAG: type II toxin-antitoxin system death-on-curing family toxin [Anaerolineales bacterium]